MLRRFAWMLASEEISRLEVLRGTAPSNLRVSRRWCRSRNSQSKPEPGSVPFRSRNARNGFCALPLPSPVPPEAAVATASPSPAPVATAAPPPSPSHLPSGTSANSQAQPQATGVQDEVNRVLGDPDHPPHFDIPLVIDPNHLRAFYDDDNGYRALRALDWITDAICRRLPSRNRSDVATAVRRTYFARAADAEQRPWTINIQVGWAPGITLWASSPGPSLVSNSQVSVGFNYRHHLSGLRGWESTLAATGTFFNLAGPPFDPIQNFLGSYQLSYVWPLAQFRVIGFRQLWASLQFSVFGQIAAGVGANYVGDGPARTMVIGLMVQPSAGAQITAQVGRVQIFAQGGPAYSWLHSTTPTSNVGLQGVFGAGYQF